MKTTRLLLTAILFGAINFSYAQGYEKDTLFGKENYYTKRAKEDAKFEQGLNSKSKSEDKKFWKEQKQYERELKKRDEIAHSAYMKGKKDAYAVHSAHCNNHCNHGYYYQYHANYYYHSNYRYERRYHRSPKRTSITLRTPRIGLSVF
ncbi:MAG: hypothetical protein ACKVK4_05080 [Flavobacteriales bacterium]|jgi:hypothetical protein|tara:strand:+ start:5247 stop:5690 length:444 start_codon:yes stop_codon:yes gene_type:complete